MAQENIKYEIRVTEQTRLVYHKSSFLEIDKHLGDKKNFLIEPQINRDGYYEQIYVLRSEEELDSLSLPTLRSIADDLYLDLKVFKLEEII